MTRNKVIAFTIGAVIVVLGLFYAFSHNRSSLAGNVDCSNGSTSCFTNIGATGTLSVDGASTLSGIVTFLSGVVMSSGTLTAATTTTSGIFTQSGCTYATSTSAETNNLTFTAAEISNCTNWIITQGRIEQTLTLPATSTVTSLIPNVGDRVTIEGLNGTSTTAANFRIAAGTGWDVMESSSTPASVATTTPGKRFEATAIRRANTDIDLVFAFYK